MMSESVVYLHKKTMLLRTPNTRDIQFKQKLAETTKSTCAIVAAQLVLGEM